MNAVLVPFVILRCFATLGGGSASRPWRRASRRVGSIPLLLGLAAVLLALSPTAVEAGDPIAWGSNSDGQCDVVGGLPSVTAIAAGGYHNLVLTEAGEVIAWGDNDYGQVSDAPTGTGFTAVAGGGLHSLALTGAEEVIAWGWNS